jgi:Zn-dependent metalloprotease
MRFLGDSSNGGYSMKRAAAFVLIALAGPAFQSGCEYQKTSSPSGDRSLSLSKPSNVTLRQGQTEEVKIRITRKGFNDPVRVHVEGLPDGVHVVEKDLDVAKDKDATTINLKADADAKVVSEFPITVSASGGNLESRETFNLTVRSK